MMGPTVRFLLAGMALPCVIGCGVRHPKAPIRTSLGTLVSIEQKRSIETLRGSAATLSAPSGDVLYVLSFEGTGEITYEGKREHDGPNRFLLSDAKGTQYAAAFAGTPTRGGVISMEGWLYSGQVVFPSGAPGGVFAGKAKLPEPRLTLIYRVPKSATGLVLVDGDQRYPLD